MRSLIVALLLLFALGEAFGAESTDSLIRETFWVNNTGNTAHIWLEAYAEDLSVGSVTSSVRLFQPIAAFSNPTATQHPVRT